MDGVLERAAEGITPSPAVISGAFPPSRTVIVCGSASDAGTAGGFSPAYAYWVGSFPWPWLVGIDEAGLATKARRFGWGWATGAWEGLAACDPNTLRSRLPSFDERCDGHSPAATVNEAIRGRKSEQFSGFRCSEVAEIVGLFCAFAIAHTKLCTPKLYTGKEKARL